MGLGCMGMSEFYGRGDEDESVRTIHRALELGRRLPRHGRRLRPVRNEELVGRAMAGRRDEVVLATKFGNVRGDERRAARDRRQPRVRAQACEASLERLGVDHIDLYYQHRVDPDVPIEETVGAMAELVEAGKVRHLGLSEAAPRDDPPRARGAPDHGAADRVLAVDARSGGRDARRRCASSASGSSPTARSAAASSPAGPLARGVRRGDYRTQPPALPGRELRAQPGARRARARGRRRKGVTAGQLALAWVLRAGRGHRPDPGHQAPAHLEENPRPSSRAD